MATHDYDIANQSGSAFRADLNNALQAIVTINSSSSAPATTFAYQYWVDTSASPALLKQRNAANDGWITKGQVAGQLYIEDGTLAAPGLAFKNDVNTGLATTAADQVSVVSGGVERILSTSSVLHFYANGGAADSYRFYKDGSTNHAKLSFESLTANRTFTFPDVAGTIALSTSTVAAATDATNADNVQIDSDASSDANRFITFADAGGGADGRIKVDGGLTYNPSTNTVAAGGFSGPLTGNVTGNVTGDVTGDVTGNADTATTATNCSRQVVAGSGLTGGGALTANATLAVGAGSGISVTSSTVTVDSTVLRTTGNQVASGVKTFQTGAKVARATSGSNLDQNIEFICDSGGNIITTNSASGNDKNLKIQCGTPGKDIDLQTQFSSSTEMKTRLTVDYNGRITIPNLDGTDNGDVQANSSGRLIRVTSDGRLKEDVQDLPSQTEVVKALRPVSYHWIDKAELGSARQIGFIAQEVQPLVPEVVCENLNGGDGDSTLSIKYQQMIATLTKALQESIERIEDLEAKVQALQNG